MMKICRKIHNWLGLLLVIQLLLWFISGLVMAVMPIEQVRGEHLRQVPLANWQLAKISPQQVLAQHSDETRLSLTQKVSRHGAEPVYQAADNGNISRYSAITGDTLSALTEADIIAAATQQYKGQGDLDSVQLLSQLPQEARQLPAPLWQVHFNDADATVFYLDANSGSVLRVRTDGWRLFDFVWMLHIMDYDTRDDINNPLLIGFSALALLFTLTGVILLWQRYWPRLRLLR